MSAKTWGPQGAMSADRVMNAAQDVAARGAKYVDELTTQGGQLIQEVDTQLEKYTGRSSDAWLAQASRLIARHPWRSLAVAVIAAYVLGKQRT
jgi:ElaB/YqjD/DUF883 family membrane-anchored ribosome-binding protein